MYKLLICCIILGCNRFNLKDKGYEDIITTEQEELLFALDKLNLTEVYINQDNINIIINGNPLLHIAAKRGKEEIVNCLIKKGVDVFAKDNKGRYADQVTSSVNIKKIIEEEIILSEVEIALSTGNEEMIQELLLSKGIIISDKKSDKNVHDTAVVLKSKNDDKIVIKVDLKNLPNLFKAASYDENINLMKMLISKGANVNDKNEDNWTALMRASSNGHKEVADLLLNKGANVNDKNEDNWTALMRASSDGHKEVADLLLTKGANVNDKTNNGYTAFNNSYTALMYASENGHKEVADLLITKGAK